MISTKLMLSTVQRLRQYLRKFHHFFLGHFDKICMKHGEAAMRAEFERILPSLRRGKVIASVDHQTPPDVSIENYKIYVSLLHEYAAKVTHPDGSISPCPVFGEQERSST